MNDRNWFGVDMWMYATRDRLVEEDMERTGHFFLVQYCELTNGGDSRNETRITGMEGIQVRTIYLRFSEFPA